ncbi:MAG: hypothetical protein IJW05_10445 [Lentisphaeria bacterium]|nr:hypothetical protein [Lentisphaeria bacterium]
MIGWGGTECTEFAPGCAKKSTPALSVFPGRADGKGALAKDRLGNWEYWEFWDYWELWDFFAPGCVKNGSPLLSVFFKTKNRKTFLSSGLNFSC